MKDFFEKFFIVEGILFGIIGILFFLRPFSTLVNLVNVCGVLIIVTGIFTLLRSFSSSTKIFLIINHLIRHYYGKYRILRRIFLSGDPRTLGNCL